MTLHSRSNIVLDWPATVMASVGVLGSICLFEVVQRAANVFGSKAQQNAATWMARSINRSVTMSGARLIVEGRENAVKGQNYIIVSNHQSLFDISFCSSVFADLHPRYISKKEIEYGIPGVSYNLRKGESALIDRKNPAQAKAAIAEMARHVREDGWSVVIFPEGTRSKTGQMKPFKPGGLAELVRGAPNTPILPVTSDGGSLLFSKNLKPIVRNVPMRFVIHKPMQAPSPDQPEAFASFLEDLQATIRSGLRA